MQETYRDKSAWWKMAIMNTARAGKFSSDRTILEYANEIWGVKPHPLDVKNKKSETLMEARRIRLD
jgi:starch phosphorylase